MTKEILDLFAFSSFSAMLTAVFSIVFIDLVLSGDNAAVIGMAICNLPPQLRTKAAICGAIGAIILRIIFTCFATLLLAIPYLNAIGAVILLFITAKLLKDGEESSNTIKQKNNFWGAVGIIILADLSMAFDNVLAVAGTANGQIGLIILGLLCSIPLLICGSAWLSKMMRTHPIILYLGAGVLVHTAIKMLFNDSALGLTYLIGDYGNLLGWGIAVIIIWRGYHQKKYS